MLQKAYRHAGYQIRHDIDLYTDLPDDIPLPYWERMDTLIQELFWQVWAQFLDPMPPDVQDISRTSMKCLCEWGLPVDGKRLGQEVQQWRDEAEWIATERLSLILNTLTLRNSDPRQGV